MNGLDKGILVLVTGLLICGVYVRSVLMRQPAANVQEIIIDRNGQTVAPAPVQFPCEEEATIL